MKLIVNAVITAILFFATNTVSIAQASKVTSDSIVSVAKFTFANGSKVFIHSETKAKVVTKDGVEVIVTGAKNLMSSDSKWWRKATDKITLAKNKAIDQAVKENKNLSKAILKKNGKFSAALKLNAGIDICGEVCVTIWGVTICGSICS